MLGDGGMVRATLQNIDGAARQVIILDGVAKKGAGGRVAEPASTLVLVERTLKRPGKQVTLGSVRIHDAKASIDLTIGGRQKRTLVNHPFLVALPRGPRGRTTCNKGTGWQPTD